MTYSTAAVIRRQHRAVKIERNARVVTDNFGKTFRITRSRRILAVRCSMTGQWVAPQGYDGQLRGAYYYATGNFA